MSGPVDLGFIGLGKMGAAIAERLEAQDVRLHVHDPVDANIAPFVGRGARSHPTARAVADAAPIVFACLPTPAVSMAVAAEISEGAALSCYVEMSTIGRVAMAAVAARIGPRCALVDAPVSGGPDGARAGTLAVMASGAPAALDRARPYLERIAGRLIEVGDRPGLAQMMKLVNNMTGAALIAATTEAIVAGAKAGLDPATMVAVLDAGAGRSSVTTGLLPRHVLNGWFDYGATMATMIKDVELGLGEAAELAVPMAVMETVAALWRDCAARVGWQSDLTAFVRAMEQPAEVRIRAPGVVDRQAGGSE